jgi:ArsR family transcriptional regulator
MHDVELLRALADGTRLRIVHLLAQRGPELCVCELVAVLRQPQATVSRHLTQLRHLSIVNVRRKGVWMHYSLAAPSSHLHRALLRALRSCADDNRELKADLEHFDRLRGSGTLASGAGATGRCGKVAGRRANTSRAKRVRE